MDIFIDFGVPIITALISGVVTFLVAAKKHDTKLEETKLTLEQEIATLEKSHKQKLETLEKEVELQQKSKEGDIVTEFTKEFMGKALSNPAELNKLKEFSEAIKRLQD